MSERLKPLAFDTAPLPAEASFSSWQTALANFDLSRREKGRFDARAKIWLLGPMVLVDSVVDALRYDRDEARVRADSNDHFALVQMQAGSFIGDYGRGEIESAAGSLTVLDMRRACWTDAGRLEAFVMSMPRAFLAPALGDLDPHGRVVAGGIAAVLSATLRGLRETLAEVERDRAPFIARIVRDLVAEALLTTGEDTQPALVRADALVSRVRAYIDDHLDSPLDIGTICAAVGTSRSTLYRAFGGSGGVLQQVLRRRLHALRNALDDAGDTRSIAQIAFATGFADKSHAARAFKREFGFTPGEYRQRGAVDILAPERIEDVPQVFERFTTLLD